jgi:hypothetical protein
MWELAPDVPEDFQPKKANPKSQYHTVETGGFFHNIYRLVHWW